MVSKLLPVLFFFSTLSAFAQDAAYNADLIPVALKNRANAVVRRMETVVDMRAPENVMLKVLKVVTVLNKNGDERAALTIFYNKSTAVKNIKGFILNSFGQPVGKFTQNDFTDESAVSDHSLFDDARVKRFVPTSITYPYTAVYEYEVRYKQNLVIPDWYAQPAPDVAVQKSSYTFICKPEDKIRIKSYNYPESPAETKTEKVHTRTWKVENINAFRMEPFAPASEQYLTQIKIAPEQFTYFGYTGSYSNWTDLGKWTYNELIKDRQQLPPHAVLEMEDLVKGLSYDREKAKRIYEYVQKKTRYISVQIGIGGLQPFPASEVHRVSYGDCKALVNYTQSLLKAVGINSLYCVVEADHFKKDLDSDFASMDQGNHIILAIPLEHDTVWVDCTSTDNPFGYLGTFTDDRTVLACTPEGGKILKTPALHSHNNLLTRKAELTLDPDGNINGSLKTDFRGSRYDKYDHIIREPYAEQLKKLKDEYDIDNINFNELKLEQKKDENPITSESVKVSVPRYAPKSGNRLYLVLNAFNKTSPAPEIRNRVLPVYVNRGYTDDDEIVYHIPDGYTIEAKPDDKDIKSPFGSYSIQIQEQNRKLIYKRKLVFNSGTYSPEKYNELFDFLNSVNQTDHNKVVLKSLN